jgi:hypothetical protein
MPSLRAGSRLSVATLSTRLRVLTNLKMHSSHVARIGLAVACCGIAVLACIGIAIGSSPSHGPGPARTGINFPLWRLLPSPHYAILGRGLGSETEWAAFAFRGHGLKRAGAQPCIAVIGRSWEGSLPSDMSCGPVVPNGARATEPPRYVLFAQSHVNLGQTRAIGETVFAIALPGEIAKVSVSMEDTNTGKPLRRTLPTGRLSSAQSAKSNLRPFSYVAFNVAANACLESVAGFDSAGGLRFDLGEGECPIG